MIKWTEDKINKLKLEYPTKDSKLLALEFGITINNLRTRARIYNIKKIKISARINNKICLDCNNNFLARCATRKKCDNCSKCKNCNKILNSSTKQFCSHKCAGKWLFKHKPKMNTHYDNFQKRKQEHMSSKEKHYNWRGGITPENKKIRQSLEYKQWRMSVFKRDNYECIICKSNKNIEADHIIPFCINKEKRFDINNGRTLCNSCHRNTNTWGIRASVYKEL